MRAVNTGNDVYIHAVYYSLRQQQSCQGFVTLLVEYLRLPHALNFKIALMHSTHFKVLVTSINTFQDEMYGTV